MIKFAGFKLGGLKLPGFKLPALGQKNNEGPPDLDQVLRDLSQKINNLFGKKNGGGGFNGSSQTPSGKDFSVPIAPILVAIVAIWLATGFYIVDQGSLGVVQRFGKYTTNTEPGPRWHWPFPIESVTVVNMEQVRRLEVGYRSSGEGAGGGERPGKSVCEPCPPRPLAPHHPNPGGPCTRSADSLSRKRSRAFSAFNP